MPPTFKKPQGFDPEMAQKTLAAIQAPPSATDQKAAQSKRLLAELGLADEAYEIDDDDGFDPDLDYDLDGNGSPPQQGVPVNTSDLIKLQRIGEMEAYISELEGALQEKDSRILDLTKKQGYALEDKDKANDRERELADLQAKVAKKEQALAAALVEIKALKNGAAPSANGISHGEYANGANSEELESVRRERDEYAEQVDKLQAKLERYATELKTLQEASGQQQRQLVSQNSKSGASEGQMSSLTERIGQLERDLRTAQEQASKEASLKENLQEEVSAMRKQLQKYSETTSSNAAARNAAVASSVRSIKGQLATLGGARRAIASELEGMREELFGEKAIQRLVRAAREQEVLLGKKYSNKFAEEVASSKARAEAAEAALESVRQQCAEKIRVHEAEAQAQINIYQAKWRDEFDRRRELHNQVVELKGNIRVLCRIRPLLGKEMTAENEVVPVVALNEESVQVIWDKGDKEFEFDRVFAPEDGQPEVFVEVEPLVVSVLDGFNVCIMAYGQTGSGKTFTMEGPQDNPGVNTRAMSQLFQLGLERTDKFDYYFSTSVLEIYNEQIFDLLVPGSKDQGDKLDVKEGPDGIFVAGLKVEEVHNIDDVHSLLKTARSNRSTFATNMNEHSSRSHLVLSLYVTGQNKESGAVMKGKLHLIDLAGSERLSRTNATGDRMKEAQAINSSLSALGDVIQALQQRNKHIPYRNSKLTRLLEDSLGGNSKCVMVVNCSPAAENASETKCSLEFASRARKVELGKAKANVGGSAGPELTKSRSSSSLPSVAIGTKSSGGSGNTTPRGMPTTPSIKRPARPAMH